MLAAKAAKIKMGDPFDIGTQMGPVISRDSRTRIAGMVDHAISQGAKVWNGADIPVMAAPFDKGYYYSPTILGVDTSMEIWREEVFGPVVVAVPFKVRACVRLSITIFYLFCHALHSLFYCGYIHIRITTTPFTNPHQKFP